MTETEEISCFSDVPKGVKIWFIIHFLVDYLIAIPLFIIPEALLEFIGWERIDPLTTRLVAAALFGIGGVSFFERNEKVHAYVSMLKIKLIWSSMSIVGILVSYILYPSYYTYWVWIMLGIFLVFAIVWAYWLDVLKNY